MQTNDEAETSSTPAVAGVDEVPNVSVKEESPTSTVGIPPNMVFNIYANAPTPSNNQTTTGEKTMTEVKEPNTTQNTQPADIGNGTLPVNSVEGGEVEGSKPDTIEPTQPKRTGKALFTSEQQEKINSIVKEAEEKAAEKIRLEFEEKERLAKEAQEEEAARKRGEVEELLFKEKDKTTTLRGQLSQLKTENESKIADLEARLAAKEEELSGVHSLWEQQIDTEVAAWPDHLKTLDPKELDPDSYTLASRQRWVERARKAALEYSTTKAVAETPPTLKGNLPTPEPTSTSTEEDFEAKYQEYLKKTRASAGAY